MRLILSFHLLIEFLQAGIPVPPTEKTIRILAVDDEEFILSLLVKILGKLGYNNVTTAKDGNSALVKLVTASEPFNLIITDLNMPSMDGVEFLRRVQEANFVGAVIVLSGEGVSMLESAFELGSAHKLNVLGAIPKPVSPEALSGLIAKLGKGNGRV